MVLPLSDSDVPCTVPMEKIFRSYSECFSILGWGWWPRETSPGAFVLLKHHLAWAGTTLWQGAETVNYPPNRTYKVEFKSALIEVWGCKCKGFLEIYFLLHLHFCKELSLYKCIADEYWKYSWAQVSSCSGNASEAWLVVILQRVRRRYV